MNEYEREREARIARNRAVMESLGLIDDDVSLAAELRLKRAGRVDTSAKKRKAEPQAPLRRSRRLEAGEAGEVLAATAGECELEAEGEAEHEAWVRRHAGKQARASVVGTASYEHTLMRCGTLLCC
jgi:hypothetical protein